MRSQSLIQRCTGAAWRLQLLVFVPGCYPWSLPTYGSLPYQPLAMDTDKSIDSPATFSPNAGMLFPSCNPASIYCKIAGKGLYFSPSPTIFSPQALVFPKSSSTALMWFLLFLQLFKGMLKATGKVSIVALISLCCYLPLGLSTDLGRQNAPAHIWKVVCLFFFATVKD